MIKGLWNHAVKVEDLVPLHSGFDRLGKRQ